MGPKTKREAEEKVCECGHLYAAHVSKHANRETSCRACGLQGFTCTFRERRPALSTLPE